VQNSRGFWLLIFIGLSLSSIFIRCDLSPVFTFKEQFIPKNEIKRDINVLKNIRLIQFLNWPVIKRQLLEKYPMIDSISLSILNFPNIQVNVLEKVPWAMIIKNNQPYIFSDDGVLLNPNLTDVELPNQKIMIISSTLRLIEENAINQKDLAVLHSISNGLAQVPLLRLQQVVIKKEGINIIEDGGLVINLGNEKNLQEKFIMLKYFIGKYRNKLTDMELIDIQFPKWVIIK
jgi:cell division septal protein FtsQ